MIQDKIIYHNGLVEGTVHSYDAEGNLEKTTFYDVIKE